MASFERMGRGDRHGFLPYQTASPISQWNRFLCQIAELSVGRGASFRLGTASDSFRCGPTNTVSGVENASNSNRLACALRLMMPAISTFQVDNSITKQHDEPLQATPCPGFDREEIRGHDQVPGLPQ
jgi:hypothetical protein